MQVSIIIVNYNVRDLLLNSVASVRAATAGIDAEIIVVDNASTDHAIGTLNQAYPDVITIPLEENVGFGAANNVGIERASGEFILLLNPDTVVEEKTIAVMLNFMATHSDAGFVSSKVILPNGSHDAASKRGFPSPWSSFCKVFGLSTLFPQSRLFGGYNLTYKDYDSTTVVDAISGCFMFCRTELLRQLRGFDTDFFMYGEDLDLCYRATKLGFVNYYHPETTIVHVKGESTRRSSLDALGVFYDAMEIFAEKHFKSNLALLMLVRLGIGVRKGIARFHARFPQWWLGVLDVLAAFAGFSLGSVLKFGSPFSYPSWALPTVIAVPPIVFLCSLGLSGGYRLSNRSLRNSALGYLFGFFLLSALTYFFKDYAFSRGVVLLTTIVSAAFGLMGRFLWLLYDGTFGKGSLRRVAFLGRSGISQEMRASARRMFLGRPVAIAGAIAPTFGELDSVSAPHLGSVENIGKIIERENITDVMVMDSELSYGEVLRAISLASKFAVRFHFGDHGAAPAHSQGLNSALAQLAGVGTRGVNSFAKKTRDRLLATLLLVVSPIVYLTNSRLNVSAGELLSVLVGASTLVGGGAGSNKRTELFSLSQLCRDEHLSPRELLQLEEYYVANHSFLFDCEIIIATMRFWNARRRMPIAGRAAPQR